MKNFIKSGKKWLLALAICLSLAAISSFAAPSVAYAGELDEKYDISTAGRYDNITQIGQTVETTLSEWQVTLVGISVAGFPLALIATVALILFVKEPRKVAGLIGTCGVMTVAFAAILFINAGIIVDVILSIIKGT